MRTQATISATTTDPVVDATTPFDPPPSQTSADNNNNRAPSAAPQCQQPQVDRPAYEDICSPYYPSNADHPGFVLAIQILTGQNFQP